MASAATASAVDHEEVEAMRGNEAFPGNRSHDPSGENAVYGVSGVEDDVPVRGSSKGIT